MPDDAVAEAEVEAEQSMEAIMYGGDDVPAAKDDGDKDKATAAEAAEREAQAKREREEWDRKRQESDQRHANERKALQTQVEQLTKRVEELSAAREQRPDGNGVEQAETAVLDEIEKKLDALDDDSLATDIAPVLKVLAQELKGVRKGATSGAADRTKELETRLEKAEHELAAVREANERREHETAEERAERQYQDMCAALASEYGRQYQTEAVKRASEHFAKKGYTQDNQPDANYTEEILAREWRALAEKGKPGKGGRAGTIPLDTGSGGGSTPQELRPGTHDEVLAQMKKSGRFKGLKLGAD